MADNKLEPKYQGRGHFEPSALIQDYLLNMIRERGPVTRSQLTNITGIPRTTVYDVVVKLILGEKIYKYAVKSRKRGRPRIFYEASA